MNLPNSLTLARIFLVPLLLIVLLTRVPAWSLQGITKETMGAVIFAAASLTDWADGYLARRRKQVTALGQWMDPLADKLLVMAALFSLVQMGLVPAWMAAVIVGRELLVTMLRAVAHARGHSLPASRLGKVKMITQVIAVFMLLLSKDAAHGIYLVGMGALWIAFATAIGSALDYARRFNVVMSGRPPAPPVVVPPPTEFEERRGRFSA